MNLDFFCIIIIFIIFLILCNSVEKSNKQESYWPYSVYSGGHYWQSEQTFNNNNRYFDMRPYLGLYRNVDLGTWPKKKK